MYIYLFLIILIIFYIINDILNIEHFYISWTPLKFDREYQPIYRNYFYNNGYMYPL